MPDLCGAFLHDIDLAIELEKRGHDVVFMALEVPKVGVNGGLYRGFKYMHFSAGGKYLDVSEGWICPHAPALPEVRKLNSRGYNRPIIATCHYDGNYTAIVKNNPGRKVQWVEMMMFINSIMEPNYRKHVNPWPPNIMRTAVVRPLMHENKIKIDEIANYPSFNHHTLTISDIIKFEEQFTLLEETIQNKLYAISYIYTYFNYYKRNIDTSIKNNP
jgi:hypothetical protein